jgi:Fe-S cluster assembly scaffold protein SufB
MMNNVAMDIVVDLVSVLHNIQENIRKRIIFMSISEAIKEHPELVRKYLGTVIPQKTIIMQLNRLFSLMDLSVIFQGRSLPNGTFYLF